MKKIICLLLLAISSFAFAEETLLLDMPVKELGYYDGVETRYTFNLESGEVSAKASVYQERTFCSGGPNMPTNCTSNRISTKEYLTVIPNLLIENKEVIYHTENGPVLCGVLKNGRIFKNTVKLVLNGNCTLKDTYPKIDGTRRFQLLMITK